MNSITDAEIIKLYEYAYPVVLSHIVSKGPKERFLSLAHVRRFITPEDGSVVVRPNNDTLYSGGYTQLKNSPYVLEIPEVENRYLLVDALNMKTDVMFSLGTRTRGSESGKYIFLYRDEEVPSGYEDYEILRSDDSRNMLLIRLESFGTDDYSIANELQDRFVIKPIYPEKIQDFGENLNISSVVAIEQMSPEIFLQDFVATFDDTVIAPEILKLIEKIGLLDSKFTYDSLDLKLKNRIEVGFEKAYRNIKGYVGTEGYESNGWKAYIRNVGNFGNNYLFRAHIAWFAYGANLPEDSIYPVTYTDSDGEVLLSNRIYRLHFEKNGLPRARFFWSVTLYGEPSQGLATNEINRYLINSHGKDKLLFNEDGSLDIILSRTAPEEKLYYNWLPTPTEEDRFSLLLRIYGPDKLTLDGKWEGPKIERIN